MRSILSHVSTPALAALVALAFAGVLGLDAGCNGPDGLETPLVPPRASENPGEPENVGETRIAFSDAGASKDVELRGSPLCGVNPGTCMPDDDGKRSTPYGPGTELCALPVPDAGIAPTADASVPVNACRIAKEENTTPATYSPTCFPQAADRRGVDGVLCKAAADCAPGFDCMDGDKGSVCRHYCCSGSCVGQTSQNAGATFCDIQRVLGASPQHNAPVCMPLKKCKLLVPGECTEKETCAVVIIETGDSGCVAKGAAEDGQSCDQEHCGAGLTCLGSPGSRRCYKLCKTGGSECGPTQTCTTSTVFQDGTLGVCKAP